MSAEDKLHAAIRAYGRACKECRPNTYHRSDEPIYKIVLAWADVTLALEAWKKEVLS